MSKITPIKVSKMEYDEKSLIPFYKVELCITHELLQDLSSFYSSPEIKKEIETLFIDEVLKQIEKQKNENNK